MQYEQRGPGDRVELPKPSIDTGMGLERMTAILQGVQSVYDIDLFKALIAGLGGGDRRAGQGRASRPPTASSPTTCAPRAS
jgi:alanyl-tRNA synthetase